jgi:hypothetical protein
MNTTILQYKQSFDGILAMELDYLPEDLVGRIHHCLEIIEHEDEMTYKNFDNVLRQVEKYSDAMRDEELGEVIKLLQEIKKFADENKNNNIFIEDAEMWDELLIPDSWISVNMFGKIIPSKIALKSGYMKIVFKHAPWAKSYLTPNGVVYTTEDDKAAVLALLSPKELAMIPEELI